MRRLRRGRWGEKRADYETDRFCLVTFRLPMTNDGLGPQKRLTDKQMKMVVKGFSCRRDIGKQMKRSNVKLLYDWLLMTKRRLVGTFQPIPMEELCEF